ncbi:hypothetical protein LJC18_02240 [Lachnospiraceae bacterium OttesenSCG-928-E19]|nr:hypothetical protein [Lachnospiraceae bacterium OttesenSCG-928-E19]
MKKLALIPFLLISFPALALTPDQIAQQQLVIQQQQEQQRQAESAARELREAERIRETRDRTTGADADTDAQKSDVDGDCPRFGTITILGNKIYSNTRIYKITDRYVGRCITRDNMNALQNDLTALYIDRKYTLARVYFDQYKSKLTKENSDVVFIVEEGIVNKVEYIDNVAGEPVAADTNWKQFRRDTKTITAVPNVEKDVFYLKDFEQALDQINRLQSNNVTMDIQFHLHWMQSLTKRVQWWS